MAQVGIEVLGALPRRTDLTLPERHLGLVQAEEHEGLEATLAALGGFVGEHVDLDRLRALASGGFASGEVLGVPPPGQRVALAWDSAFSFVYPHLLAGWRTAGAQILPFSPLADEAPDDSADVCWLPGGYPELHAGKLAAAERFRSGLQAFALTRPVHGECGGYMAIGQVLVDAQGWSIAWPGCWGWKPPLPKADASGLSPRHAGGADPRLRGGRKAAWA